MRGRSKKSIFHHVGEGWEDAMIDSREKAFRCRAGARYLYVDEHGNVSYCSQRRSEPGIPLLDYTSRDFDAIRSMLVGIGQGLMPEWRTLGEAGDFGTLLLELYAYMGDVQNYYIDRVGSEAFLGTAQRRLSVLFMADMLGYRPIGQQAATVVLSFTLTGEQSCSAAGVPSVTWTITFQSDTGQQLTTGQSARTDVVHADGTTATVSGPSSFFFLQLNPGQTKSGTTAAALGDVLTESVTASFQPEGGLQ